MLKQCEVEPEHIDVSHHEIEKRIGKYVSIIMIYDEADPFFDDKNGVGLQHARIEGNAGKNQLVI